NSYECFYLSGNNGTAQQHPNFIPTTDGVGSIMIWNCFAALPLKDVQPLRSILQVNVRAASHKLCSLI
uniref:Uncharacterized protein n=1 Tax=Neolamprologus brichardi TaxID=32507 RepID=A0A3Q4HA41_NEOBR